MVTRSEDENLKEEKNAQSDAVEFDNSDKVENETVNSSENQGEERLEDPEKLEDQEFEEIEDDNADEEPEVNLKVGNLKLQDENRKLSNELDALKERLLRTNAEYENFRKRTAKEKEGIYTDACEDILKNMFPVLDNLERAISASGTIDDLKKGVEMTIRQFKGALEKLNVEEIATDGEFDPNFHNAVMHVDDEKLGKNVIVDVFQKGYKKGTKVLRHSMVKVAN